MSLQLWWFGYDGIQFSISQQISNYLACAAAIWADSSLPALGRHFSSGDAFSSRSLCHDAAAAAFATAQTLDELRHGRPRLDPEANEITLGDDAAMPTAQAAHRDHPPWTLPFPVRSRGHGITPTQQQLSSGMDRIWALIPGNQPVT
jgi:hypothetical protein